MKKKLTPLQKPLAYIIKSDPVLTKEEVNEISKSLGSPRTTVIGTGLKSSIEIIAIRYVSPKRARFLMNKS